MRGKFPASINQALNEYSANSVKKASLSLKWHLSNRHRHIFLEKIERRNPNWFGTDITAMFENLWYKLSEWVFSGTKKEPSAKSLHVQADGMHVELAIRESRVIRQMTSV